MLKHLLYFSCFIILSPYLAAQRFLYQAPLSGVKENGLYKIPLVPGLKKYMSKKFRDVRILDSADREVPYVLITAPLLKEEDDFGALEIISQEHFKNHTEIVLKNAAKENVHNLAFNVADPGAYISCSVESSEDIKQWESVSTRQEPGLVYLASYTNPYQCVYFPETDYLYYRLTVEDGDAKPLKADSAGYFKTSVIAGRLNELPFESVIKEEPERKISSIRLSFDTVREINRIDFKIENPDSFARHAVVFTNRTEYQKHKTLNYRDVLFEFDLVSGKPLLFDVPSLNERELYIEIENDDAPPLEIESIHCRQLLSYLVCVLDTGNKYTLKCGNAQLRSPGYDLTGFSSAIPQLLPEAHAGQLKEIPVPKVVKTEKPVSFFETRSFLWSCLLLGALLVVVTSAGVLKNMGKGKKDLPS